MNRKELINLNLMFIDNKINSIKLKIKELNKEKERLIKYYDKELKFWITNKQKSLRDLNLLKKSLEENLNNIKINIKIYTLIIKDWNKIKNKLIKERFWDMDRIVYFKGLVCKIENHLSIIKDLSTIKDNVLKDMQINNNIKEIKELLFKLKSEVLKYEDRN